MNPYQVAQDEPLGDIATQRVDAGLAEATQYSFDSVRGE